MRNFIRVGEINNMNMKKQSTQNTAQPQLADEKEFKKVNEDNMKKYKKTLEILRDR